MENEIRMPNAEIRKKSEARNQKVEDENEDEDERPRRGESQWV
jgi:hypothetical protein